MRGLADTLVRESRGEVIIFRPCRFWCGNLDSNVVSSPAPV